MTAPRPAADERGFGLYVHWPFCLSKCPYCDFNSHVRDAIDQARWRRALLREIDHFWALAPGRKVTSIFFGGGTPSLMAPATVAAVIESAAMRWGLAPGAEITLEANPGSSEAGRFRDYRAAGINRLSLGVQSLDDAALRFLGRGHDRAEAMAAIAAARAVFPRFSFDLIYALPGQSLAAWRAALTQALTLAGDHLSLYQLTIEAGTAFHAALRRGALRPPGAEHAADLFETTQEIMDGAGLPSYEISNHARPGAECRHNLTYWRYGAYAGVGPGAHGRLNLGEAGPEGSGEGSGGAGPEGSGMRGRGAVKTAIRQIRSPEAWLTAVEARGHGERERTALGREERLAEILMMGLRLRGGVARPAFRDDIGCDIEAALDGGRLATLCEDGFLVLDDSGLRTTPAGRDRLDAVLGALLA